MSLRSGRWVKASTIPASSITSLRAVLIKVPPLGMESSSSLLMDPLVSGVAGMCKVTKSALKSAATESTGSAPRSVICSGLRKGSYEMQRIPNPFATRITFTLTLPQPCRARVLPLSSVPLLPSKLLRTTVTIMPNTNSATALALAPGVFWQTTSLALAASRSMLSKPAPARVITFSLGAASITSLVARSDRMIIASTSATAPTSSLESL
mmetsp:Transcript_13635/g.30967  ORF Transcript_13635/g.30967 Transcript_13635/m.30967 type:complete len:210 (-) Transcript_13635:171-800(-)